MIFTILIAFLNIMIKTIKIKLIILMTLKPLNPPHQYNQQHPHKYAGYRGGGHIIVVIIIIGTLVIMMDIKDRVGHSIVIVIIGKANLPPHIIVIILDGTVIIQFS